MVHRIVPNLNVRAASAGHDFDVGFLDEPWGPRRFFVRDPNGAVVNVVGHPD